MSDKDERNAANEKSKFPTKPSAAVPCRDCGGSGRIVLLISSRACARCGGAGRLDSAGAGPAPLVEGPDGAARSCDAGSPGKPRGLSDCYSAAGPEGAAGEAAAEGPGSCVYTYDEQGRLRTQTWTGTSRTVLFEYPATDPGDASEGGSNGDAGDAD